MSEEVKKIVIAIDGYSSCGKSTFAKTIAKKLGYIYIDSGAMYRAVTLWCIENDFCPGNEIKMPELLESIKFIQIEFRYNPKNQNNEIYLNGKCVEHEIRTLRVADRVSLVSRIREVRERMVDIQRELGKNKGIVMDGRDIGTVVFPKAELKIFMTASPEIRAERRYLELLERGLSAYYQEVLDNILKRDQIDTTRAESPLRKAEDALLLDNSHLSPEEQMVWFEKIYQTIIQRK